MTNLNAARENLEQSFAEVDALLTKVDQARVNHKPTEKWSFGEEMVHLIMSTSGTALLLSSPEEKLIPADHPSRSYDEIVEEYLSKLPLNPTAGRAIADQELKQYQSTELQASFSNAAETLFQSIKNWEEQRSDQWMVWKHPFLGKMTAREMVYFTVYHTRHHLSSLLKKALI